MSTDLALADDLRTERSQSIVERLKGGSLECYDGTRPATKGGAVTDQTLLLDYDLPAEIDDASNGVLEVTSITAAQALDEGTPTWGRLRDSVGGFVADCDVGAEGSNTVIWLDNLSLLTGAFVSIISFEIEEA